MKKNYRFPGIVILFALLLSSSLFSQLISTAELEALMGNDNLRIIDTQKAKKYKSKHIQGAINLDYHKIANDKPVSGTLKSPEELAKLFGDLGISENSKIVVYDAKNGKGSSRVYVALKYIGAKDVHILNGQLKKWMSEKRDISTKKPRFAATSFKVTLNKNIYVDADFVKNNLNNPEVIIADARSKDEYKGKKGKYEPKGHIKNAVNLSYSKVMNKNGTFKTKEEIAAAARAVGIVSGKQIITYCASGVRASVLYFALHIIGGLENTHIYEGSYADFVSKYPELTEK